MDGVGHQGGVVGVLLVAPYIDDMGALVSMIVPSGFLVAAAVIAQFGVATRAKRLDEVSP